LGLELETTLAVLQPCEITDRPAGESPEGWSTITSSKLRVDSIRGLLVGASVGESLGLARCGLSRAASLKMFGRGPLTFNLVPGWGWGSAQSWGMLACAQAALRSRNRTEAFRQQLTKRLRWLYLTAPFAAEPACVRSALRLMVGVPADFAGSTQPGSDPFLRAMFLAVGLQATGGRPEKWIEVAVGLTHRHPMVEKCSLMLAYAAQLAVFVPPNQFDPPMVLARLRHSVVDPELSGLLAKVAMWLDEQRSTAWVAKRLGYGQAGRKEPPELVAVVAIYCWLRHPRRYRTAVERAVLLGGKSSTVAAVTGGLAGIQLGVEKIPPEWRKRLVLSPHGGRWLSRLVSRLVDWPHGAEDLHHAPALPSRALRQLLRSAVLGVAWGLNRTLAGPWRMAEAMVGRR
jgi:ADP-ribosylglycohydrolase